MKQQLLIQLDVNSTDEFDKIDSYYSSVSDFSYMDVITTLIEDISYPVFIVQNESRRIIAVNKSAKEGLSGLGIIDETIDNVIYPNETVLTNQPVVFFNNQWYLIHEDIFTAGTETYTKIQLQAHTAVPDAITLKRWKHMIAVMLHRFRSPLTGISGYLDLLIDETEESIIKNRALKIDEGVSHLADLMDELEHFYHIESNFDLSKLENVDLNQIINKIEFGLDSNERDRIQYFKLTDSKPFRATNDALEKVLMYLLENALRYSDSDTAPITITQLSNKSIKVSNESGPIPSEISNHLFHPFVTSKANNLGIGLTKALLYANQFGATIFQTDNGESGRVTFTICFP